MQYKFKFYIEYEVDKCRMMKILEQDLEELDFFCFLLCHILVDFLDKEHKYQ